MEDGKLFQRVKYAAFIAAILGLFSEFIALINIYPTPVNLLFLKVVTALSPLSNFTMFDNSMLEISNVETRLVFNYFYFVLYVALLVGAIAFVKSKGREIRLIRFVFSIVLLYKVIRIIYVIVSSLLYYNYFSNDDYHWPIVVLVIVSGVFWGTLSYFIVINLSKTRILDVVSDDDLQKLRLEYIIMAKIQTAVFRMLDLMFGIFLCFSLISFLARVFCDSFIRLIGPYYSEAGIFLASLFMYTLFFEALLGATPLMLFFESRVVTVSGERIGFRVSLLRLITRLIPSGHKGNDGFCRFTKSIVRKEKQRGVSVWKYSLLVPLFLLIGLVGFVSSILYDMGRSYYSNKIEYETKVLNVKNNIRKLTTNSLLKLEEIDGADSVYLKVEAIHDGKIVFSVLNMNESEIYCQFDIEKKYLLQRDTLQRVEVDTNLLYSAFTTKYDDYESGNRNAYPLLKDNRMFEITKIFRLFGPAIVNNGEVGVKEKTIYFSLVNGGWSATLVSIDNIEGNLKWQNDLPQRIKTTYKFSSFDLVADDFRYGERYKATFTIVDSLNNRQVYLIEGEGRERTLTLMDDYSSTQTQ